MSAPLVVNTRDGACWTRRTVTEGGIALYALADVCQCPEFVMTTLAELAERGIVGSADVLPMPVGPQPRSEVERLSQQVVSLQDELSEARLDAARSRRERDVIRERVSEPYGCAHCGAVKRSHGRRYISGAGMHGWERPSDEQVKDRMLARRAARMPLETAQMPGETYPPALPWAALMDDEDLHDFLDELAASAITHASNEVALAEVEATCGRWRAIAEAQHAHNTAPGPVVAPENRPREVPCGRCGDPVYWTKSTNSDGGFWCHVVIPGRVLDHFGEVAGAEGRHAFEKEYQGESDAKRRLARCRHCGEDRDAPMHTEADGITRRIAPTQTLRETTPADLRAEDTADILTLADAQHADATYNPTFQTIELELTATPDQWTAWQKVLMVDLARTTNRGSCVTSHATWRGIPVVVRCWFAQAAGNSEAGDA